MTTLPEWIEEITLTTHNEAKAYRELLLIEALSIAWAALEHFEAQEELSPEMGVAADLAREAMRRISKLGETK